MQLRATILLVVLAICVQCLPVEPKFRQMSLQAQESQTNTEIQAISARIAFLQKLNKLTYDTTLFTRKLRWLLRRSLSEKPTVAEVVELMNKELELSQAQAAVAVEGVADELKLEVKQGIIALKAGLAFIEDNYKAGSDPEADAIIAKIKANISALEARFGKKPSAPATPAEASTAPPVQEPPAESSTAVEAPAVEQSTAEAPPVESSTVEAPPAVEVSSSTAAPSEPTAESSTGTTAGGGSLINSETETSSASSESPAASTTEAAPAAGESSTAAAAAPAEASTAEQGAASTAPEAPLATVEGTAGTGAHNATNDTSSSTGDQALAESPLSSTATFF